MSANIEKTDGYPEKMKSLLKQNHVFRKIVGYEFVVETRIKYKYKQWKIIKNKRLITDVKKITVCFCKNNKKS